MVHFLSVSCSGVLRTQKLRPPPPHAPIPHVGSPGLSKAPSFNEIKWTTLVSREVDPAQAEAILLPVILATEGCECE